MLSLFVFAVVFCGYSAELMRWGIAIIVFVVVVFCGSSAEARISMCVKLLLIVYDVVTFVVINVFWLLCRGGKYECVWNCCHCCCCP